MWNLAAIERAFADAALDPTRWNSAMDTAAAVSGSVGAVLLPIHGRIPGVPCSNTIAPMIETYFRDGWVHRDQRERGVATMMQRGVFTDLDFTNADEIKRHPYYQEFLGPHGLRWFGGLKLSFGDDLWCLAIQRSVEQGPYSPQDVRQLVHLSQSIAGAAALARALGFASAQATREAFELSGSAVVLLNRRGEILRLNPSAEKALGSGLRVANKRLVSNDVFATAALDRALHALMWDTNGSALHPPVALPRRSLSGGSLRPLLAYPVKLSSMTANALADCQALLVLVDPEKKSRLPEASLRSGFGLSAAEARLAARLAAGDTIETVAAELGIAKETARNQLKAVFVKTGVRRQAELVALFARLLGN